MLVKVVGTGEPDAKLGGTQRAEVAFLLGVDVADVRNGKTRLVGSIACAVISGSLVVVHQAEGGGELVAAVYAHSGRVDADGSHIAAYGTHSIAHSYGFGRALVEGSGEKASIIRTLREGNYNGQEGYDCCERSFHR